MEAYKDKAWQRSMKLRLDINCMMADFVGEHGLSMADIEKNSAQYIKAAESMAAKRANSSALGRLANSTFSKRD